ncbi:galactose-specific lectin nattectin-like [Mytilus trossulus]|uniref:galactose-specific lectin nattectin-like n=1 Tax=Mytilus trossulus TaxID=6551 RepID=UPI00300483BC
MLKIQSDSLACPNGWLKNENKCYFYSDELKPWTDAKISCEADEGMLVEVDSKCENDFIKMSASMPRYWLGGTDQQKEGVWIWSHSQNVITFSDWAKRQPDNYKGREHCLELWNNNGLYWNDCPCHELRRFVCEKDLLN